MSRLQDTARYVGQVINPRNPRWHHALPHAVTAVLVALAIIGAYVAGVFTGPSVKNYFATHYRAPQPVPRIHARIPDVRPPHLAASASINLALYPRTGDQDGQGSCAAWASAWAASYLWRTVHPGSYLRFSPRYEYDHFSDVYNDGKDGGSWPDGDLETLSSTGIPRFKAFPYPPYVLDNPIPTLNAYGRSMAADNLKTVMPITIHPIGGYQEGQGQGLIDGMKAALSQGHPVMIGFPVYPEYDQSTGNVDVPGGGESSRGGHENVALAYDDGHYFPAANGYPSAYGGFLVQNQWTANWAAGGRAWMSYRFVGGYVFGAEYLAHGLTAVSRHPFVPNHHRGVSIVPKGWRPPPHLPSAAPWYVHGVYTHDTGINLTDTINSWGTLYGVSPVGLTAVLANESGINQYADRYGVWPDVSFGVAQFTVATASGFGVCSDTASCKAYLDNPYQSIRMAALFLAEIKKETCLDFLTVYVAYNAGPGYGCGASFYYNPTGTAAAAFANFVGNYNYVLSVYGGGRPPPKPLPQPRPFPIHKWCAWADGHHKACVHPWQRHRLTWPASIFRYHTYLRGFIRAQWFNGHPGYDLYSFARGKIFAWPKTGRYRIHW